MKLTVEIVNEKLNFSYEIGSSKHSATSPINTDIVVAFADILRLLSNVFMMENKEFESKINARIWMEDNTEEAMEFLKNKKVD